MGRGGERVTNPVLRAIPDFRRDVALKYVKRGYHVLCTHLLTLLLVPLAATGVVELGKLYHTGELKEIWTVATQQRLQFNLVAFVVCCTVLAVAAVTYVLSRSRPVYMVDYHVYKHVDRCKVTKEAFMVGTRTAGCFDARSIEFQEKIFERSGLGDETYLPEVLHRATLPSDKTTSAPSAVLDKPPNICMESARQEARDVMFSSVQALLDANNLRPQQVDILIVNCSLFNPTPSLSAMIINHFKMRTNIISYNLAGMGCSAGVISISLARELLQVYPNSRCIVVSTENITQNWYFGNQRSMLIPNCLFRVGGAAILLSNRSRDRRHAKFQLQHVVRTHMGRDDLAYECVYQREDDKGMLGVHLSKELMAIAGHSLKANITTLGPLVLPVSEQLLFFFNLIGRKLLRLKGLRPYIPDFKLAFEHFCIHTGGRGVIEEIEKQLALTPALVQPSKDALFRFGNTSSSSVWYVLSNIESKRGIRRGDRVWQIAFGSGFKCNSAVWRALKNNDTVHEAWRE